MKKLLTLGALVALMSTNCNASDDAQTLEKTANPSWAKENGKALLESAACGAAVASVGFLADIAIRPTVSVRLISALELAGIGMYGKHFYDGLPSGKKAKANYCAYNALCAAAGIGGSYLALNAINTIIPLRSIDFPTIACSLFSGHAIVKLARVATAREEKVNR